MDLYPSLDATQVAHFREIAQLPSQAWAGKAPARWVSSLNVSFEDTNNLIERSISRSELIDLWRNPSISTETCFLSTMAWGGMKVGHGRSIWESRKNWLPVCEQLRAGIFPNRVEAFEALRLLRLGGKLPGMGPAYFTKVLFFARPIQDAYILDQWTARSIHILTQNRLWPSVQIDATSLKRVKDRTGSSKDIRVSVTDRVTSADYGHYCQLVEEVGKVLGKTPCYIEEVMFGQGGRTPTVWRSFVKENWFSIPLNG